MKIATSVISDFLFDNEVLVYLVVYDKKAFEISEKLFCDVAEYIDDNYVDENTIGRFRNYPMQSCREYNMEEIESKRIMPEESVCLSQAMPCDPDDISGWLKNMDKGFADTLFYYIDKKEITDETILERLAEANKNKVHVTKSKSGIVVKGIDDMAVRFSRCCSPVPGDEIVGFVTRGRGMSIHRTDCVNMMNLPENERARLIPAEWGKTETGSSYMAEIKIYARDRQGLLMDMTKIYTEMNIDVKSMNVRTSRQGTATIETGFIVHSREELGRVIDKLRKVTGIIDIERAVG